MLVDIQITAGVQIQIERAVPSDEFQHVIEKADSRTDASFAATVQVQAERDIGLVGLTMNFCGSWHYSVLSRIASCLGRCSFTRAPRRRLHGPPNFQLGRECGRRRQADESLCG